MGKIWAASRSLLIILACAGFVALCVWLSLRWSKPHVAPVEGNPAVPPRSEEAVRMEEMFRKLLDE